MTVPPLGRLVRLDPRSVWKSESGDFTPWLATEANLALLGEAIGLDLELEATEKDVGPFRADVLCRDTATGHWVLIENQLERTDHGHLGQLLTYAAGLKAVTVVWVANPFTDEHRAALDWLNEVTREGINFFGLEIELWQIGTSAPAPKINVVSKPNDWAESISKAASALGAGEVTETKQLQRAYWAALADALRSARSPLRPQKPLPQHWTTFALGRSGVYLTATVNTVGQRVGVHMTLAGATGKPYFAQFRAQRDEVERAFGGPLEWRELPDRKESQVGVVLPNADPTDRADWSRQHAWLRQTLERLQAVMAPRARALVPAGGPGASAGDVPTDAPADGAEPSGVGGGESAAA